MNVQTLRKFVASVSATALLLSTFIVPGMGVNTAQAAEWFQPFLDVAGSLEMSVDGISGNPGANMNRCDTAILYVEAHDAAFGVSDAEVEAAMSDVQFTDTTGNCQVAAELMLDWGLMFGQGGTEANPSSIFGANDILNKNDQAVVAFRYDTVVLGNDVETSDHRFGDVDYNAYFGPAILHLTARGFIVGEGGTAGTPSNTFGNAAPANRITTLVMVFRVTEITDTNGEDTGLGIPTVGIDALASVVGGGVVVDPQGDITATLAENVPAGTLLNGQARATVLAFNLVGNGTVTSLTLRRGGLSNQTTVLNAYLADQNGTLLSDGYSFNNDGDAFVTGLDLKVQGSMKIYVQLDIAAAATSGSISVSLVAVRSGGVDVAVTGVNGNQFTVTFATGLLGGANVGANTVIGTPSVNPGTMNYVVWGAPFAITTNEVQLKSAAFRLIGSAEQGALQNAKLYLNGVDLGSVGVEMTINGSQYIVFTLATPAMLDTGTQNIEVRADVVKGSARTVQLNLQKSGDVVLYDTQVGVNIAATGVPNNAASIAINAGTVTFTLNTAFQQRTKLIGGTGNGVIADFDATAFGENAKANSFVFTPVLGVMTPAANGLQNVTVYLGRVKTDGSVSWTQVGTQTANWTAGPITITPGSAMTFIAGEKMRVQIRADIRTVASVNYTAGTVSANLVATAAAFEGLNSKNSINQVAAVGNTLSVQVGSVSLSKNTGYADSQLLTPNQPMQKVASFTLQNNTSEKVRATQLVVTFTLGGGTVTTDFSTMYLASPMALGGNGSTPVQLPTSGPITYTLDFILAEDSMPGNSTTIDVLVDANSVPAAGTILITGNLTYIGQTSNISTATGVVTGQTTVSFNTGTVGATPSVLSDTNSTSPAQLVTGDSTDKTKFTINFNSTGGTSTISRAGFVVTGSTTGTVTSVKVGNGSAPIQTIGGLETASINGLSVNVPLGGAGANVPVMVSYSKIGINGIASASTSSTTLAFIEYQTGSLTRSACTAAWSVAFGITCTAVLTSPTTPTYTLVGSQPSFTIKPSTETLINGKVKLIEVTVTADPKGDIRLAQFPITVSSTGFASVVGAANNIEVQDVSGTVIPTTNAGLAVAAGGSGSDTIVFGTTAANSYLIPAGTSVTFRIYATAATVSGATGTTSLNTRTGAAANGLFFDVAGNNLVGLTFALIFGFASLPQSTIFN